MTRGWSPDDNDDYEIACCYAWESSEDSGERGRAFLQFVRDAAAKEQVWALDLLQRWGEAGARASLNDWQKANTPVTAVTSDGRILSKTRTIGIRRRNDGGEQYHTQTLFDLLTWEELEVKVAEYTAQIGSYRDDIAVVRRLLELRTRAPGTANPQQAADALGITVEDWLMREETA